MENAYVINCPICGSSLDYEEGAVYTVCSSCGNTVHRKKSPKDINLNLKYAIVSDGSKFDYNLKLAETEFHEYDTSAKSFKKVQPKDFDAITLSRIESYISELTLNFNGSIKLREADIARREVLVKKILELDKHNIYACFIRDIVIPTRINLSDTIEIFGRADSLIAYDYITSFLPIKVYGKENEIVLMQPIIKYIMHLGINQKVKYTYIIEQFKLYCPFACVRPSTFINDDNFVTINIIEGYKELFSALNALKVSKELFTTDIEMFMKHFENLNNHEIAQLFLLYILRSPLYPKDKDEAALKFIGKVLGRFGAFNDCHEFLGFINTIGYERGFSATLSKLAIDRCSPMDMSFDGYAILNRFIRDSRVRFAETYKLYIQFNESLLFKQMLIQVLFAQKILNEDDMLLYIDVVKTYGKSAIKSEKLAKSIKINKDTLADLGLTEYSEMVKKYHSDILVSLYKNRELSPSELELRLLIEKKRLFGARYMESTYEMELGDKICHERLRATKRNESLLKYAHIVAVGLVLGLISLGVNEVGVMLMISIFSALPLYILLNIFVFNPLAEMLNGKNIIICEILLTDERTERLGLNTSLKKLD